MTTQTTLFSPDILFNTIISLSDQLDKLERERDKTTAQRDQKVGGMCDTLRTIQDQKQKESTARAQAEILNRKYTDLSQQLCDAVQLTEQALMEAISLLYAEIKSHAHMKPYAVQLQQICQEKCPYMDIFLPEKNAMKQPDLGRREIRRRPTLHGSLQQALNRRV